MAVFRFSILNIDVFRFSLLKMGTFRFSFKLPDSLFAFKTGQFSFFAFKKGRFSLFENPAGTVFRFPAKKTEPEKRKQWMIDVVSKVNANLMVSDNTVVCEVHWPKGYPTYRKKGHDRPAVPPSIFPGVPPSIVP